MTVDELRPGDKVLYKGTIKPYKGSVMRVMCVDLKNKEIYLLTERTTTIAVKPNEIEDTNKKEVQ